MVALGETITQRNSPSPQEKLIIVIGREALCGGGIGGGTHTD
jgi:hypothetical protein